MRPCRMSLGLPMDLNGTIDTIEPTYQVAKPII